MAFIRVSVTVPEVVLQSESVLFQISQKMKSKTGPELRAEFRKTVEGWETAPEFAEKYHVGHDYASTQVYPSGTGTKQYGYVNNGTEPHPITPRRGGMLGFQPGYRAATRPRVIGSRAKYRYGGVIATPFVLHPGSVAREFDAVIAEAYQDTFAQDMQEAIRVAK